MDEEEENWGKGEDTVKSSDSVSLRGLEKRLVSLDT